MRSCGMCRSRRGRCGGATGPGGTAGPRRSGPGPVSRERLSPQRWARLELSGGGVSARGQPGVKSHWPGDARAAAMPQDKARYELGIREKRAGGGWLRRAAV